LFPYAKPYNASSGCAIAVVSSGIVREVKGKEGPVRSTGSRDKSRVCSPPLPLPPPQLLHWRSAVFAHFQQFLLALRVNMGKCGFRHA